jgi:ABC-type microcin C transport system duplicated ATPase subunit YejF
LQASSTQRGEALVLIENLSFLPLTAELPPGSGKSTLGRLVLRLLATAGKVFYDGTDLGALALPRCAASAATCR